MPEQNDVRIVTPYLVPIHSTPFPLLADGAVRTFALISDGGETLAHMAMRALPDVMRLELALKDGTTTYFIWKDVCLVGEDVMKAKRLVENALSDMLSFHNLEFSGEL